jgi:hypothetical protein
MALVFTLALLATGGSPAFAHGHTQVGDYELVIGFRNEPAYQGEPNGLDLIVTNTKTNEKVTGLEKTLNVEIIYGSSKKQLEVRPQFGREGAYTADVLPSRAGDYTWHIWGEINGTPVDVTMTSGPDTFNPVQPKSAAAFPAPEPAPDELQAQAASAAQLAQTALIVGGVGVVLGAAGLVVGFLGMRSRATTRQEERQGSTTSQPV